MRFIDGLKPDIKAVVLVQRPKSLDIPWRCCRKRWPFRHPSPCVQVIGIRRSRHLPRVCHCPFLRRLRAWSELLLRLQLLHTRRPLRIPSWRSSRIIAAHWVSVTSAAPSGARITPARPRCCRRLMHCGIHFHLTTRWRTPLLQIFLILSNCCWLCPSRLSQVCPQLAQFG